MIKPRRYKLYPGRAPSSLLSVVTPDMSFSVAKASLVNFNDPCNESQFSNLPYERGTNFRNGFSTHVAETYPCLNQI